ncbi:MAG: NAD(P)H-binding protein [Caldilineaceae bacterium]
MPTTTILSTTMPTATLSDTHLPATNPNGMQRTTTKLLIFGATGTVGCEVVNQALAQGYGVTAFARTPSKLEVQHANLTVLQGDVLDPAAVERAVRGQDVVLCVLGAGAKGQVRSEGTKQIIQAMGKRGVRRLICQSTLGVGDSRSNLTFFWKYIMFGLLLRNAYADHVQQEAYVKASQLDWTIVRPAALPTASAPVSISMALPGQTSRQRSKSPRRRSRFSVETDRG